MWSMNLSSSAGQCCPQGAHRCGVISPVVLTVHGRHSVVLCGGVHQTRS